MDRHAELVHYIHQVRYKVPEGHGKAISWGNKFTWIQKRRIGPVFSFLDANKNPEMMRKVLHGFIVDGCSNHFGLKMFKPTARVDS